MAKQGISKAKAIQNALARLGMQASPEQVVATLAGFGIDVSEGLVRQVNVDMLKQAAKVERQRVKAATVERPQVVGQPSAVGVKLLLYSAGIRLSS